MSIDVKVKLSKKAKELNLVLPKYKSANSVSMAIASIEHILLPPNESRLFNTGLSLELPAGYEAQIRPYSDFTNSNITVLNAPLTIDNDYNGEIVITLANHGHEVIYVKPGDVIAQMTFAAYEHANLIVV